MFYYTFVLGLKTKCKKVIKSIVLGKVPSEWKHATVPPIFKKGTKGDPGNYRPVSLTSVPCKLLESIIKDKIMEHLLENNLIKDSQHGFMLGKSCATNLVEFMDVVSKAVDDGEAVTSSTWISRRPSRRYRAKD